MRKYQDLAAELMAASQMNSHGAESLLLLNAAIEGISDLRSQTGIRPTGSVRDALSFLTETADGLRSGTAERVRTRTALMDASVMIRDLCVRKQSISEKGSATIV